MNKDKIKNYGYGFILPFILRKRWFWFADPFDVDKTAMVNFFSYNEVEKAGFRRKEGQTTIIDLQQDIRDIWSKMRQKFICKQIQKGEQSGITVERDQNWERFKKIYEAFRRAKNLPKDRFDIFKKNAILFSAYYNNKMVAGGIFISDGLHIRALVLSSLRYTPDGQMRDIVGQANRMVIWEAIKYAKDSGHETFDLGGINPGSENKAELSLTEFKEAFGGERVKCYYYHKVYSKLLKRWMRLRGFNV